MRCFITIGPEDSGNRMMHNILLEAGCEGDGGYRIPYTQRFDQELPTPEKDIAWLRSVPHGGSYPNLVRMILDAENKGYDVQILIMTRAWWVTRLAATKSHTGRQDITDYQMDRSYKWIFDNIRLAEDFTLKDVSYLMVSYDELVHDPCALHALMHYLNLPVPEFDFRNGNEKWYEDYRMHAPVRP